MDLQSKLQPNHKYIKKAVGTELTTQYMACKWKLNIVT